jgi:hypothetical protein
LEATTGLPVNLTLKSKKQQQNGPSVNLILFVKRAQRLGRKQLIAAATPSRKIDFRRNL